jgi:hypothetical protein
MRNYGNPGPGTTGFPQGRGDTWERAPEPRKYRNLTPFKSPGVDQPDDVLNTRIALRNRGVRGRRPRNPPGQGTPRAQSGKSLKMDHVPPSNVPYRNYWGMSNAAPARQQYNRSFEDNTPINFRRYVNASGVQDVQIRNPVADTSRKRIVLYTAAGYLWAVAPRIPGQTRDNFGGFHARGIDPQSYAAMWNAGPGSQPINPGGPGRIAGRTYIPPAFAGGTGSYGAGS